MTENQIKEAISEAFVRLVLSHDGFKVHKAEYDHGVDLNVGPVNLIELSNGDNMYEDSSLTLNVQLKSTTQSSVEFTSDFVEYKLRNKNYLTLKRMVDSPYIKMILILFILPSDRNVWIDVFKDNFILRKHCFWYMPTDSTISPTILTKGKDYQVKIQIPLNNHLLKDFRLIYNTIYAI